MVGAKIALRNGFGEAGIACPSRRRRGPRRISAPFSPGGGPSHWRRRRASPSPQAWRSVRALRGDRAKQALWCALIEEGNSRSTTCTAIAPSQLHAARPAASVPSPTIPRPKCLPARNSPAWTKTAGGPPLPLRPAGLFRSRPIPGPRRAQTAERRPVPFARARAWVEPGSPASPGAATPPPSPGAPSRCPEELPTSPLFATLIAGPSPELSPGFLNEWRARTLPSAPLQTNLEPFFNPGLASLGSLSKTRLVLGLIVGEAKKKKLRASGLPCPRSTAPWDRRRAPPLAAPP